VEFGVEFGMVLAVGLTFVVRPRCATQTPLSRPSSIPQMSRCFILGPPFVSVYEHLRLLTDGWFV
jgi:hypothetical protein